MNKEGIEYVAEAAGLYCRRTSMHFYSNSSYLLPTAKLDDCNTMLICNFILCKFDKCATLLDRSQCHTEAMLTARTYAPELLEEMTGKWKSSLLTRRASNSSHPRSLRRAATASDRSL